MLSNIKNKDLYVKVKNKYDVFIIFTKEYSLSGEIKDEVSRLKNIDKESIRLFYNTKRLIEDKYTNHDQQIDHRSILYACFKLGIFLIKF